MECATKATQHRWRSKRRADGGWTVTSGTTTLEVEPADAVDRKTAPPWRRFIRNFGASDQLIRIRRKALRGALERARAGADGKNPLVRLTFATGALEIASGSGGASMARERIACAYSGPERVITLDNNHITTFARDATKADDVTMDIGSKTTIAVRVNGVDGCGTTLYLMQRTARPNRRNDINE